MLINEYFSHVFFPYIGNVVAQAYLYSFVLSKWVTREIHDRFRYRMNILCIWNAGWIKSATLYLFNQVSPIVASELTVATSAALRGTMVDGVLVPPVFLTAKLITIPELAPVLGTDTANLALLLKALEDGLVQVHLAKNISASESSILRLQQLGAELRDSMMEYRMKAPVWACTHTVDAIDRNNYDAFISRFFCVRLKEELIDKSFVWQNYHAKYSTAVEAQIRTELTQLYNRVDLPNFAFMDECLPLVERIFSSDKLPYTARTVDDFRRLIIADKYIYNSDPQATVNRLIMFWKMSSGQELKSREIIATLIMNRAMSVTDIMQKTGYTRENITGHLSRLHATYVTRGKRQTRMWYIDSPGPIISKEE